MPIGVLLFSAIKGDESRAFIVMLFIAILISVLFSVFHFVCKLYNEAAFLPDTSRIVENPYPAYIPVVIYFICFALSQKTGIGIKNKELLAVLIIVLLMCVVEKYLKEFVNFLVVNSSNSAGSSQRRIFNTSYKLGLIFTAVLTALYTVVILNENWLKQIERLVGMLLSRLKPDLSDVTIEEAVKEASVASDPASYDLSSLEGLVKPNMFLAVLIRVVLYVTAALAVVFVIILAYWGIKELLYKLRNKDRASFVLKTDSLDEVVDEVAKLDKKEESLGVRLSGLKEYFSFENKIRRRYKKYIIANAKRLSEIKLSQATPRECDEILHMGELLHEYEDVRYKLNEE